MNNLITSAQKDKPADVRILTRLEIHAGPTGEGNIGATRVGAVIDTETTGLDQSRDRVVELAIRRFRFDDDGIVTQIDHSYSWLEDPGRPLPEKSKQITGLTDADLEGKAIDDAVATRLLNGVDVVIAHNAAFDRPFVDGRLPRLAGRAWACSCQEVDWYTRGLGGTGLGFLLHQNGWFHDGHRAADDADALLQILRHRDGADRTALAELLETASTPGWIVRALGANFDLKEQLKARRYRWDMDRSVWFRELQGSERAGEEAWLNQNIYSTAAQPRSLGPEFERVDWTDRYARLPL